MKAQPGRTPRAYNRRLLVPLAGVALSALVLLGLERARVGVLSGLFESDATADPGARTAAAAEAPGETRQIRWPDLVPAGWDPMAIVREKSKSGAPNSDADPRSLTLLRELREIWDDAPVNEAMDGALVKLPGYVVPLEQVAGAVKEFLLVPYFGACIHTPPPPANQIVYVVPKTPAQGLRSMDVIWVSGKLTTKRKDSGMGKSGYHMDAFKIEPYVAPR
jgi:hypothetical protein